MAKKIELTKEQFEEIRKFYLFEKMTTKQISKKIKISETVICKNLKKNGLYINTNDIDKIEFKKGDLQKEIDRRKDLLTQKEFTFFSGDEIENDEKKFIAVCKITGKEFNDYKNSSGSLTNHLNEIFPGFVHPSNFKKREYKIKKGKYWHEQYFNIIEVESENIEKFKCVYCDWQTNDLNNKSGCYTSHLKNIHNLDIENYLKENKEHEYLFKTFLDKKSKRTKILSNSDNFVVCKICGEKLSSISNSHLKKHGITQKEYKLKHSKVIISKQFRKKMKDLLFEASKKIKKTFTSKAQKEIKDFLLENNINTELNDRKILSGIEIDILCQNKKIGIEYNGNMFHSENFGKKGNKYHLNKTELMNLNNYFLLQIFEDEWELKKDIVKSKLLQIFGENKSLDKIYARKCEIKEINKTEKDIFLNKNHIQGADNSNIYLGAFFNNKLVSVMTFDNKRRMSKRKNEENSYELLRFSTDIEFRVIGIASKLLSFFVKKYNPKSIISFADRRWTLDKCNNLYTNIGFELKNTLKPDYTYYNPKLDRFRRYHKFGFGKNSIKKKFPEIYSGEKTEWMMMQEAGYDRIWDCGKFCYELRFN